MDLALVSQLISSNGAAVEADQVCVVNMAAFVMGFYFTDLITGYSSHETDGYPIDNQECVKIGDELVANAGDMILLEVHAHAGETLPGDSAMIYTPGAPTITYTCWGTTLNFHCQVNGEDEMTE